MKLLYRKGKAVNYQQNASGLHSMKKHEAARHELSKLSKLHACTRGQLTTALHYLTCTCWCIPTPPFVSLTSPLSYSTQRVPHVTCVHHYIAKGGACTGVHTAITGDSRLATSISYRNGQSQDNSNYCVWNTQREYGHAVLKLSKQAAVKCKHNYFLNSPEWLGNSDMIEVRVASVYKHQSKSNYE